MYMYKLDNLHILLTSKHILGFLQQSTKLIHVILEVVHSVYGTICGISVASTVGVMSVFVPASGVNIKVQTVLHCILKKGAGILQEISTINS